MYRSRNIQIASDHPLFAWCDQMAHLSTNLYNAGLFRERQLMTSAKKDPGVWTENEIEIRNEVTHAMELFRKPRSIPASGVISYTFLDELMKVTSNPDYYAPLPRQSAQNCLKHVCRDLTGFFESMKAYQKDPTVFTGRPKLPKYKHKGGISSFDISNQDCVIRINKKGSYTAKLPLTKHTLSLGKKFPGSLKEVHVTPNNGIYQISFVFDIEEKEKPIQKESKRIAGIDLGVNNLMAVVNNCGLNCMIFNGRPLKAINQYYNKQIACIQSEQTKGSDKYFVPTKRSKRITLNRNNRIKDTMFKTGRQFIDWCVENRIDTAVIGANPFWKQSVSQGPKNNQSFVQIPYDQLKRIIQYLGIQNGIRVITQEESYTSQASFLDNDFIPVYGKEEAIPVFSGKRIQRGLYKSCTGETINADLHGAANIIRKCFPDAFIKGTMPDFRNIQTIRHPEDK